MNFIAKDGTTIFIDEEWIRTVNGKKYIYHPSQVDGSDVNIYVCGDGTDIKIYVSLGHNLSEYNYSDDDGKEEYFIMDNYKMIDLEALEEWINDHDYFDFWDNDSGIESCFVRISLATDDDYGYGVISTDLLLSNKNKGFGQYDDEDILYLNLDELRDEIKDWCEEFDYIFDEEGIKAFFNER